MLASRIGMGLQIGQTAEVKRIEEGLVDVTLQAQRFQ